MSERRMPLLICTIAIILIVAPYLFAAQMTNAESVFGGFLINPIDGHSYLAKMQQGQQGEWRFVLPYTAEAGAGAYLFIFYILLGHLSRLLNLPLILTFHGFRILGALLLLLVLYQFNKGIFKEQRHQILGFAISALGSGLGWLAIFAGIFTSDFWVAEAYPLLSMYTNPHFSIGLALMILALLPGRRTSFLADLLLGLGLGIIQPFAVVIVLIVKAGKLVVGLFENNESFRKILKADDLVPTIMFASGGGLILVYQYWSILSDPVLSLWNAQNITESPGLADLLISLSPCLILAGLGVKRAWQGKKGKTLVVWAAASLVLVLVPWNLQRRFLTGIYVPLSGLAVYGWMDIEIKERLSFRSGVILLMVLVIPTNIIIAVSGIQAAARRDPKIYLERDIYNGLTWIKDKAAPDALVLADEKLGLYIPSVTGRRVIFGHPFETVNAELERKFLRDFTKGEQENLFFDESIAEREIDILFLTVEISVELDSWIDQKGFVPDYENELLKIYLIGQQ